ncbi:helix-turn-helix domain-containing protein [Streptococcus suis]|uniref:helix-turn-helix transcriptional regulator n=1 Tax=Streptococcus suis TaxID=1307 RepID=UPI0015518F38|nr:helix-turn-helix transcriptional regulator [Streptococcus suis]HEM4250729.1 helix-turn-helix transcriptional regulator [Streptococcus suis]HEM4748383.1 helix-turn-helix transcriptional regulator [Streptococcus suis]HEM6017720.1 helix-turn-helix transcriptional regulator [Streptococcus suis]
MKWSLKALRASDNLTQKQAGQLVGVTADTWANWEKGKTNPDVKTAYKIAEYFGLSIDDIIFLDEVAV